MYLVAHISALHIHTHHGVVQLAPLAIAIIAYGIGLLIARREKEQ